MSITAWRKTLTSPWRALADLLWPPSPEDQRQRQLAALAEELRQRQSRMLRRQRQIEVLRDRLVQRDREAERLTALVQSHISQKNQEEAYRTALALEKVRRRRVRTGERLQRQEEAYHGQQSAFERLKRRRAALQGERLAGIQGKE